MVDLVAHFRDTLIPLLMAAVLGGAVGYEREQANHPAGLRTHILVCVGSALIMQVSMYMWVLARGGTSVDPGRIAAQVVSGIGFLGAGTIMREGTNIRGLTTAASLWVVSGVGLAVGAQLYMEAVVAAAIILLTLQALSIVERRFISRAGYHTINLRIVDEPGRLGTVASAIGRRGVSIRNVQMRAGEPPGSLFIEFRLKMPPRSDITELVGELMTLPGVQSVVQEE